MLMVAIVDDDPKEAAALRVLVENFFQRREQAVSLQLFSEPMEFLSSAESHDIVFMDIRMEKLDGLEVARLMRKLGKDSMLIFVTHMAQLAIKGYEVDALDFIVKPADQYAIDYVLERALKRMESVSNSVVSIKAVGGIISLASSDITYVEVLNHNLTYHTTKGNYTVRGRLTDAMEKLDEKHFILCNRSFVVNLRHVTSATSEYLVVDGTRISVSKSNRKSIMRHFSNYIGENL